MAPLGLQEATCSLIGNCIGANNVKLARRFFLLTFKINTLVVLTISLTILFARHSIIRLYTEDARVHEIVAPVLILLSLNFFFDGTQTYL